LNSALRLNGFNVRSFDSPSIAIRAFNPKKIDAVISDYHFPKMKGTEVIKAIHRKRKDAPVFIITGDQDKRIETISLQTGASAFFRKPLDINKVITALEELGKDHKEKKD
jgi:two-component system nitrogen regulation response regulator GlnG